MTRPHLATDLRIAYEGHDNTTFYELVKKVDALERQAIAAGQRAGSHCAAAACLCMPDPTNPPAAVPRCINYRA